ncbi:MAG: DEAD/DEAH box helicase family protein, partial [Alphaproteobacteria bacterium]|nr:DEAD/DEAH box helicase family protein [Alphaproteobacteria bacterium]
REHPINAGEIKGKDLRAKQYKADYVLVYKNRKLAVIEAKSNDIPVAEGVAQAKIYASKLELDYAYATNGEGIYEICRAAAHPHEKSVSAFPTPDQLWQRVFGGRDEWLHKFNDVPFDFVNGSKQARYYQEIAVNKVMAAIANNQTRILLNLATGTGKTFIAFQIAWKLFQTRWNLRKDGKRSPRILFLTDRNILASQAYLDFGGFSEDALVRITPQHITKRGGVPKNGSIFFTIFQTFMSGGQAESAGKPGGKPYFGDYEPDFFDFVIIDECHRGGADDESSWREILTYFSPAVQLGLTATPKRVDNIDTYRYFGEPVYKYSLKDGIQDGFLTPFKVKRIQTTLDEYIYTDDDDVIDGAPEKGRVYTQSDFNNKIEIIEREIYRVKLMLDAINPREKTLVFCANQAHAALIRDLINQETPIKKADYCVRVTAFDGTTGDNYLRQFQDNDKNIPTILTTSKKLTTGVDARNVRNIILMRPIKSMIEFKQIIGRGTRLYDGKYYFTIIDFVNAYYLFNDPEWDGEPIEPVLNPDPIEDDAKGKGGGDNVGHKHKGDDDPSDKTKIRIKLADGKIREIQSMSQTLFLYNGQPISAEEFIKRLFNTLNLPGFFESEASLRELWANPDTRNTLLKKLEDHGCAKTDLINLQKLIHAENSDLFDVLEYISYARKPIPRSDRVAKAQGNIYQFLNERQREFIDFVLDKYIKGGVDELDTSKLSILLKLKYHSVGESYPVLGQNQSIQNLFIGFQKHLYLENAA